MKKLCLMIMMLVLGSSLAVRAADKEEKSTPEPQIRLGETPAMSEIPMMKQQGQRMAVLMEQLSKESNPEIRRRIMAEAMCPQ
jgi:hypothetical protein